MLLSLFFHNIIVQLCKPYKAKGENVKKIAILMILFYTLMYAKSYQYSISGGLIGSVADATVSYSEKGSSYRINIDIAAKGMARMLSDNLKEHHTSYGSIKHGEYYAKEYKIDKTYKDIRHIRRYLFDYTHQKITKISTKWKKEKKIHEHKERLKYFAHNDILTLYHNIMRFKKKHKAGNYTIKLAGAEKEGGKLTFTLPKGKTFHALESIKLFLRRSFFSKGQGGLTLGVDASGIVKRGILDNVKLLGEVTLKRTK
jgi:hypothetical protein